MKGVLFRVGVAEIVKFEQRKLHYVKLLDKNGHGTA